jgi:uncharacterized membrane protein
MTNAKKSDADILRTLRARAAERRRRLTAAGQGSPAPAPTLSQRFADSVASGIGSWTFVLVQSALLAAWIGANAAGFARFDPYPFILLNLFLSFQAAYTAPIIMMSQNRQSEIDRRHAEQDFQINCKAEIEIETLHQKVDMLRERELAALSEAVARLTRMLEAERTPPAP